MHKEKILVVGASGTIGTELVKLLTEAGIETRATTSKRAGAGQVQVNLATGEGLTQAFEGVDKAFLLSPPGYADQRKILSPLIQEAKRRGLKKVVLLTAMGANAVDSTPFRQAEIELEKSGLTYNIVRPNWFIQNFATFWGGMIREQKKILLPAGSARTSFIDARDVAAVVAKLLTGSEFDNRDFDLTGDEALSHGDVAAAIGQGVRYENVAPAVLGQDLVRAGLPQDYVDFMLLIFGFLREGYNARTTDSVKAILGRNPRHVKEFLQTI